ncbi:MAG: DsbA family protein [Chloroflexota bacterium]|nr:DsbA family protein [Chloroflexota bacterium]
MRLRDIGQEYEGRVEVEWKALPLEWVNNRPTPRDVLEGEWWLAALHEPRARFAPYTAPDYPDSTLPAFEATKCASEQGAYLGRRYDLALREAFFGRNMNISRRDVLLQLAGEIGLDVRRFEQDLDAGRGKEAVRADYDEGSAFLDPRGSPSFVLPDNTQVFNPAAADITFRDGRVVAVGAMPCLGDDCDHVYRDLLNQAAASGAVHR